MSNKDIELYYSEQNEENEGSKQNEASENDSLQIRQVHKNKYIKKIKDLGAEQKNTIKEESSIKSFNKKQKNRYSAKLSRDRKKLYIEVLQEKQKLLSKQLECRKKQLEQTKGYLQRVVNQNKTMSGFTASRHQMMKKIEGLLERAKKGQNPQSEINQIIDSLRYRIGATGRERINTINEYFRQIVNLSLPALHRYMMWSAAEDKHLFGNDSNENQDDQWFLELKNSLNLSEEQKRQIQSKKQFLKQQKQLLESLIHNLKDIKEDIEQKSLQLQNMIDGIREILTPLQAAHFILFIEKNKYRKELNLCEATLQEEEEPGLLRLMKRE